MAREIADVLKHWISQGAFLLTEPVAYFHEPRIVKKLPQVLEGKPLQKTIPLAWIVAYAPPFVQLAL